VNEKKNGRERIVTEVNFTEGSTSDLAAKLVAAANDALHVLKKVPESSAGGRVSCECGFGNGE
jgi:hypothetical protein